MFTLSDPRNWQSEGPALIGTIDAAIALGTRCVYGTTGSAGGLSWTAAADRFAENISAARSYAAIYDISLLIEANNPQFADLSFVHSLRDALDLATTTDLGVCLDLHAVWWERDLDALIQRSSGLIRLVQLSDYVPGTRTLDRDVPGDGIIPLKRLVASLLNVGYDGLFDIELYSLRPEGHLEAIQRSAEHVSSLLDGLGA